MIAVAVVISRRPDAVTNPQFYAEDGARWFADAYNLGWWNALWSPYAGHYLVQPRLVAALALPFGPANAPMIYNIAGILFQVAPALFFLSNRFRPVVPSLLARSTAATVYLLMPSTEMNVTDACAQFHLAILATLVLVAPAPSRRAWLAFDIVAIVLCATTGAFVYVLFPLALFWWWLRRQYSTKLLSAVLAGGTALQTLSLFLSVRPAISLAASVHSLLVIVSDRVVLGGLFAEEGHTHVLVSGLPHSTAIAAALCLLALTVAVFAALRAPWELRIFGVAALGFAAASLAVPLASWPDMAASNSGERYFLMAQVAWVVTLLWTITRVPGRVLRVAGLSVAAAAFASGLLFMWAYPAFPDYHWPQEARAISASAAGTHLTLRVPPWSPSAPWAVDVTVK